MVEGNQLSFASRPPPARAGGSANNVLMLQTLPALALERGGDAAFWSGGGIPWLSWVWIDSRGFAVTRHVRPSSLGGGKVTILLELGCKLF